jgi:Mg-chelatase subunit ChlD
MSGTKPLFGKPGNATNMIPVKDRAHGLTREERLLVVFVLDRSGSMNDIKSDTIGEYNKYVRGLQEHALADQVRFCIVQFNATVEKGRIHSMKNVHPLSDATYVCHGSTALFDAIGATIKAVESVLGLKLHYRPLIIIMTDGQENASKEWTNRQALFTLVQEKQALGWQFLFLGANEDSIRDAQATGLGSTSMQWDATKTGTRSAFQTAADATSQSLDFGQVDLEELERKIREARAACDDTNP